MLRKSKLYRFDKEANQWKERGGGTVKLLKHKSTGKIRLVMRQSKLSRSVLITSLNRDECPGTRLEMKSLVCGTHVTLLMVNSRMSFSASVSLLLRVSLFIYACFHCVFNLGSNRSCLWLLDNIRLERGNDIERKKRAKDASDTAGLLEKLSVEETETEEKPVEKEKTEAEERRKASQRKLLK
ncbi:Ran-binding protein 1-like protein b [Raphanus sativus]|nr:Ran-binding protein 1-like protein b [Raphanus sativus]